MSSQQKAELVDDRVGVAINYKCFIANNVIGKLMKWCYEIEVECDFHKHPVYILFDNASDEKEFRSGYPEIFNFINIFIAPTTMDKAAVSAWKANTARSLKARIFVDVDDEALASARALGIASFKYLL